MKISKTIAIALVAMAGLAAAPAQALPRLATGQVTPASDVIKITNRSIYELRQSYGSNFHLRGGHGWYNGHRGSRHYRRGWRRHNGWWFPAAAFALGVIVAPRYHYHEPRPVYRYHRRPVHRAHRLPDRHYRWCTKRYRTYRVSDNSYVPKRGYRAQCRSPYWP